MDVVTALFALLTGLVALDIAAMRLGVDSRPSVRDDHSR